MSLIVVGIIFFVIGCNWLICCSWWAEQFSSTWLTFSKTLLTNMIAVMGVVSILLGATLIVAGIFWPDAIKTILT